MARSQRDREYDLERQRMRKPLKNEAPAPRSKVTATDLAYKEQLRKHLGLPTFRQEETQDGI